MVVSVVFATREILQMSFEVICLYNSTPYKMEYTGNVMVFNLQEGCILWLKLEICDI